jgi:hypothetical protein
MGNLIWTQASLEPKRKFRYLVSFSNFADVRFLAQTCDRPGIKVANTEHKYFDKTYNHPGRVTYDPNPLNIKLVDIQNKNGSGVDTNGSLLSIFVKSGLQIFTDDNEFRTIGKNSAVNALGRVTVTVLNSLTSAPGVNDFVATGPDVEATGTAGNTGVAEKWYLNNAWLESIKPDSLDYGSDDILTVTIQVRYDYANFEDATGKIVI